jgi:hypothetical protein
MDGPFVVRSRDRKTDGHRFVIPMKTTKLFIDGVKDPSVEQASHQCYGLFLLRAPCPSQFGPTVE